MPARVTVLGSVNMDLVATAHRLPIPGETLLGTGFRAGPGGKGANQATAAARAGAQVTFLGAVGDDAFAPELRAALDAAGVDTALVRTTAGPSGIAAITVDAGGENSIVVVSGANATVGALSPPELDRIARADVLLMQLELPLPAVTEAASHARLSGTLVMLNPSPVQELPDALVESVDVLIVNATEARQLGPTTHVPYVVTTHGAEGAHLRGPDLDMTTPAPAVDVVDTTGAGDAFAGALAACWHLGPEVAMRRAVAAGAVAATRPGAAAAPTAAEVDALLVRHDETRRE